MEAASRVGASLAGRRILIVEDELIAADEIARTLRETGAEVLGAVPSVQKALDLIRTAPSPDAVVIDIYLDGELAYPIADALSVLKTPFVFATARGREQLPERYRQAPHCAKPLHPSALLRELSAALAITGVRSDGQAGVETPGANAGGARNPTAQPGLSADVSRWIEAIGRSGGHYEFAKLFATVAPKIKRHMQLLGATDAIAEELAQEVMLTLWSKAGQFDPTYGSAMAWIYAIARNARIDFYRRDRRAGHRRKDWIEPPSQETPEQIYGARVDGQRVHAALAELPPEQAEILRLAFWHAQTHAEIARSLRLPLGTVKSRLRLAIARMRSKLADEPD